MIIFEKYEITQQGQLKNINTGKFLKVEEKPNGRFVKLTVEGKTKRINLNDYNYQITEEVKPTTSKRQSRRYIIRVTEMDGTIIEFKTFKAANDNYGLRKDYLNYCITEKFQYMLDKVNLKKVEKIPLEK